jgi:2-iminobutanoate/2-iminopropanoate deaminase/2-aminomuconate deaminase
MARSSGFTVIPHKDPTLAERLPLVPGVRVHAQSELLFLSGVIAEPDGFRSDGTPIPPASIEAEAESVLQQLETLLAEAGATFKDVVRIQKFLTDLDEHGEVVAVMRRYFGTDWPTSTTVEVPRLVYRGFRLEIDAIAVIPAV